MKEHLKIKIYQLFDGEFSIKEFEEWVYNKAAQLEKENSEEFYFELISFNYQSKYAKQEFFIKF